MPFVCFGAHSSFMYFRWVVATLYTFFSARAQPIEISSFLEEIKSKDDTLEVILYQYCMQLFIFKKCLYIYGVI